VWIQEASSAWIKFYRANFFLRTEADILPAMRTLTFLAILCALLVLCAVVAGQTNLQPDVTTFEDETMRHYQALLRFDTMDPPGNEKPAADYLQQVLEKEGIPTKVFALEPNRPNVVARLKGNGRKRPLLVMAHTDVVNVDPKKWTFPPFSATRNGGYVYGRGTVDDKDNVVSALMTALSIKRLNVPLDRDVIFLFEAGEEGTTRVGIEYMVNQHFPEIEAEFCIAEGGGVVRQRGQVKYATVQTTEKIPRAIELTARGVAGHGSVPLKTNAVVHLADAVSALAKWRTPIRINDTTGAYFSKLAEVSTPEEARWYRDILSSDRKKVEAADEHFLEFEPRHASMLRTSISPNQFNAGYRINVIPSEAKAMLDVRTLPDEDPAKFLEQVKKIVNDPAVDVAWSSRDVRPGTGVAKLDSEAFKALEANVTKEYKVSTIPTMSTGATDMAYLRAKGIQCYGIGPATDVEDGPLGFGAHSDQERVLESEILRFAHFNWDVIVDLARLK
jgi:acetylornithine deacetylase/succinyl-diaminopimelate desuccinylase-like protein